MSYVHASKSLLNESRTSVMQSYPGDDFSPVDYNVSIGTPRSHRIMKTYGIIID